MTDAPGMAEDSGRARRTGRGRLSTIDMLPEEADEAIAWANAELRERSMPQTEILRQFNAMLADKGIKGVSKGAFSRYSIRVAIELRKMEASRQITDAILERLPPGERGDSMIAATEMMKYRIVEMVMGQEQPDPKLMNIASLALSRMSITALRETHGKRLDRKDQREAEAAAQQIADEIAKAGTSGVVVESTMDKITRLLTTGTL